MQTELTGTIMRILIALGNGPLHGYGIMKQIKVDTDGRVAMNTTTLYRNIRKMVTQGLVEEIEEEMLTGRRYYQLTGPGIEAGQTQLDYILSLARVAQDRLIE